MRHYEMMIILDGELDERTVQPSLEKFLTVVTKDGGTVDNVDTWGRRPILLSGALLCALTLGACGLLLRAQQPYTPALVVVCVVLFNAAFGYSWGPIPWAWTPEIMPLAFRAKGASLAAATNWVWNWIVGQLTPVLQERIGWRLYMLHAGFCVASFVVVYFLYPETQGVPLEEMDAIFGDQAIPVPPIDDADDTAADPEAPRLRRSISSHPRFHTSPGRRPWWPWGAASPASASTTPVAAPATS